VIQTLGGTPVPIQDAIVRLPIKFMAQFKADENVGLLTDPWAEYFGKLVGVVSNNPVRANTIGLRVQGSSISATDFGGGGLSTGYYQISYYARIVQPASTSSSLQVAFDWVDQGVAVPLAFPAITGNTTTTTQSNTFLIYSDGASPIRYATTYGSVGGSPMKYDLSIVLQVVHA
jgi:hypothetical protein